MTLTSRTPVRPLPSETEPRVIKRLPDSRLSRLNLAHPLR